MRAPCAGHSDFRGGSRHGATGDLLPDVPGHRYSGVLTPSPLVMKPSRPFVFALSALVVAAGALALATPRATAAAAADTLPLSTALTPVMIDYFGLDDAFTRPSIAALLQCNARQACGASDSSQVQFFDANGEVRAAYDGAPTSVIEEVRRMHSTPSAGVTELRTRVRRYLKDEQGRIVMNGIDSIVKVDSGSADHESSTLTRVHRYSDVRYLVNDLNFVWPLTGLVVLELSNAIGPAQRTPIRVAAHGAVSFDGTQYAQILTAGALTHRVDLVAKRLETTMPER